ncbi:meiotic recombination protein rec12, partial [Nosema bombycis CQ1]
MNSNKILKNLKSLTLKALTTIRSKSVLKKLRFYEILFEMNSQGIIRNKREIFYLDVPIFGKQEVVDSLIKETCKELKEIPFGLNITNTLKGIYFGEVEFVLIKDDRVILNDPLLKPQILNSLPFQPRTILIPDMNQV